VKKAAGVSMSLATGERTPLKIKRRKKGSRSKEAKKGLALAKIKILGSGNRG
jgi:hypothetical protein